MFLPFISFYLIETSIGSVEQFMYVPEKDNIIDACFPQ